MSSYVFFKWPPGHVHRWKWQFQMTRQISCNTKSLSLRHKMIQCLQRSFAMLDTITITKHTWQSRHQMLHKHGNTTTMTEWPNSTVSNVKHDIVQSHYNTVNILQNIDNRHPIGHRLFQRAHYVLCNVSSKVWPMFYKLLTALLFSILCYVGPSYNGLCSLIARFMGQTWGPSGADRTQVGPMLAPWTLVYGFMLLALASTILKITVPTFNSSLTWQNMN